MSQGVKAVFFGSDPIGLPILRYGMEAGADRLCWTGVCTQPDRARGRGKQVVPNAIKAFAVEHGIPVLQPPKAGPDLTAWMKDQSVELALVLAYGHILRREHLEAPALGMWNFHGSDLPALRGASPIETAIAEGMDRTAMTLMRMVLKMDAGPVVDREPLAIGAGETAPVLRARMGEAAVPLLERNLAAILQGRARAVPQEEDRATYCRKLEKADGLLDFGLPARVLVNRMRACTPWPGTAFLLGDQRIKVGRADIEPAAAGEPLEPGRLRIAEGGGAIAVDTPDARFRCLELQRPGGRMLPASDFLRGFPLESGTKLPIVPSKPWVRDRPFSFVRKPT